MISPLEARVSVKCSSESLGFDSINLACLAEKDDQPDQVNATMTARARGKAVPAKQTYVAEVNEGEPG